MTQQSLDRQIARATGESLATIRRLGFSIADPSLVVYDPEPAEGAVDEFGMSLHEAHDDAHLDGPSVIDWDEIDAARMSIFPADYRRRVAA